MTVNCLCISSSHCLLSFSCLCAVLRGSSVDAVCDQCSLLLTLSPMRTALYHSAVSVCCVCVLCLMSFTCHCEVLRVQLERRHSTSVHY